MCEVLLYRVHHMMVGFDHNIEAAAGTNPLVVKIPKELESEKENANGAKVSEWPLPHPMHLFPIKLLLFKQNI